jgi:hypothetical protein
MPELHDVLALEADRHSPGRVPPFEEVLNRRRRQQRGMRAAGAAVIVGVLATTALVVPRLVGDEQALQPSVPSPAATSAAPDVLLIECRPAGPALPNGPRVAAQADGVHYTFRNETDVPMHVAFALGGDTVAPRTSRSDVTSRAIPQQWTVSCSDHIENLQTQEVPVVVEDPHGVFVPVPECHGTMSVIDYAAPMTGDPVALTLRTHDRADVVGYPQGSPRLVFTGDQLIGWEGAKDSWTPSQVTQGGTAAPHTVAAGIKAPPPTQLTHTDEFGVVKAVRTRGDALEVDIDRVDMLGGAEAEAAAAAAGTEVSNDYFLRNDNPLVRTYRVSPTAVVWGNIAMLHQGSDARRTTLARWEEYVGTASAELTLFHFEISDGVVVGIEEQYRP